MATTITDLGNEIFFELGSPTDISIASIAFWLRSNIGHLNSTISTSYEINSSTPFECNPTIGENEKIIFKKLYLIYYYNKFVITNLGASSFDAIIEYTSDGSTIRKVNRNEVSKVYLQLRNQHQLELEKMISMYKMDKFSPLQVAGDDNFSTDYPVRELGIDRQGNRQSP